MLALLAPLELLPSGPALEPEPLVEEAPMSPARNTSGEIEPDRSVMGAANYMGLRTPISSKLPRLCFTRSGCLRSETLLR